MKPIFGIKFLLDLKLGKWVFFSSKINIFENFESFLNLFSRLFWNYSWWHALIVGRKWIFKENPYYTRNVVSGVFLDPKSMFLNFCLNILIRCLWNYIWWQELKSFLKWLFGFLRSWHFKARNPKIQKFKIFSWNFSQFFFFINRHSNGS